MSSKIFHVKLMKADGNGNLDVIYPVNKAEDVILSKNTGKLPENMATLNDVLVNLNPAVFSEDIGKSNNLENVTNDRQIKGLAEGTTENHILVFGNDGYTVKDSGYTIQSNVPADAKFTDTTYGDASTINKGLVQLSDSIHSKSTSMAATSNSVNQVYELANEKVGSIVESNNNGAISVDGKDVSVTGLKSAAFKDASEFATAEQGELAQTSIQTIKVGTVSTGDETSNPDVIATTFENITTLDFRLPKGSPGTRWYYGNAITGTSTTPTVFIDTNIERASVHDFYLNTSTGYIYECIKQGNSEEAEWTYLTSLKGDVGSGTVWYVGTIITGNSSTGVVFQNSGISNANLNDHYLNTDTSQIYKCTLGGDPSIAEWTYISTLTGVNIPVVSDIPDVDGIWFSIV